MYHAFYPGQVWLDTEGKRIHAHGGSVIQVEDTFYWYGENKEKSTPGSGIWTWGVRCYKSKDLYNWEDCGLIIPPEPEDAASPMNPYTANACMDRPHIIYNQNTKKFVCWMKVMRGYTQTESVYMADSILGPYIMVRKDLRPLGMNAGDFDLVAARDGKAYYYFERVHSETICADLTEDYTNVTGYYSTHFPHPEGIPYVREATAHFQRKGKHYLITSGTTGYLPNPSEIAISDTWHGPFTVLGNPHPDDKTDTSFHSQVSSVFKVPGKKDLYIAIADRWMPNDMDLDYHVYKRIFEIVNNPDSTQEEKAEAIRIAGNLPKEDDTSIADYVWLPFRFDGETPFLDWKDEWKLEDYE